MATTTFRASTALRLLRQSPTIRGGGIFLIGGIAVHVLYYLYRIAMGRLLTPAEFGEVTAFLSLMLILTVPALPMQTIVAKIVAELAQSNNMSAVKSFCVKISLAVIIFVGGISAGAAFFAKSVAEYFQFSNTATIYMLVGIITLVLGLAVLRGILQGLERFVRLTLLISTDGFVRFVCAVLFVGMGFGVAGAVGGLVIAVVIVCTLAVWILRDIWRLHIVKPFVFNLSFLAQAGYMIIAFFVLSILLHADILIVKHYFSPYEAGLFSAFATLGKGITLFGMLLSGVLFPVTVRRSKQGVDVQKPFLVGLGLTALLSLLSVLILWLNSSFILEQVLGSNYLPAAQYVGLYAFIMAGVGLIFYTSNFLMALGHFRTIWIHVAGGVLYTLLLFYWHSTFGQLFFATGVSIIVILATLIFFVWKTFDPRKLSTV